MKKFLKLIFSLVLVLGLALSLVACGSKDGDGTDKGGDKTPSGEGQGGEGQGGDTGEDTLKVDVKASEAGLTNMLGSGKLYVTTFGQADRAYLQEIVDEAFGGNLEKVEDSERKKDRIEAYKGTGDERSLAYTFDNQLKAADVETGSLVIAVVGYTSKGIAAEITQAGEVKRAGDFAAKEGINLVIVQLSGKARRGESSDPIIAAASAGSKLTLIFDNGDKSEKGSGADYDGKYSTVWCKDKSLFAFSDEWEMNEYFKVILGL